MDARLQEYLKEWGSKTTTQDVYEVRYWHLPSERGNLGTVAKCKTLDEAVAKAKDLQAKDDVSQYGKRHIYFINHTVTTTVYDQFVPE